MKDELLSEVVRWVGVRASFEQIRDWKDNEKLKSGRSQREMIHILRTRNSPTALALNQSIDPDSSAFRVTSQPSSRVTGSSVKEQTPTRARRAYDAARPCVPTFVRFSIRVRCAQGNETDLPKYSLASSQLIQARRFLLYARDDV